MTKPAPDLSQLRLQPGPGSRIPNRAYFDASWFDAEQVHLFEKLWIFAGVVNDLPEPGSYMTRKIGRVPVLLVKDESGEIKAFHNACRHRGAQLLEGKGQCKSISCPYHAWNYGLNGELRAVPQHKGQFPNLKLSDWPLKALACETIAGMIFVHVGEPETSLRDYLGETGEYADRYDLGELEEIYHYRYPLKSNWKFFAENTIDWLHLFYLHSNSLNMYDHAAGWWEQTGDHFMSFEVPDKTRIDEVNNMREGLKPIPNLEVKGAYGAHLIFPNLPFFTSDKSFTTLELIFDGPKTCEIDVRLFALPGSTVAEDRKTENSTVFGEDALATERLQAAVESPLTEVGPLAMTYEEPVVNFHNNYMRYLQDHAGAASLKVIAKQ